MTLTAGAEVEQLEAMTSAPVSDASIVEAWSLEQMARGSSPRSISERARIVTSAMRRTGRTLLDVQRAHLVADMARPGLQPSSRSHYKGILYNFFTWMQDEQYRLDNPAARLPKVKVPRKEVDPVTTADIEKVLSSGIYRKTRTWVLLYAYQGFRASEIAAVSSSAIDWERRRIRSDEAKGGVVVWRPLHPLVFDHLLAEYRDVDGWFFPSPKFEDRHVSGRNVSNVLCVAMKRAGVNHRAHQLRAWFATEMVKEGHNAPTVAAAMRHADLQSVMKYTLVPQEKIAEAMDTLPIVKLPARSGRQRRQQPGGVS